jgi:hypothetical protein
MTTAFGCSNADTTSAMKRDAARPRMVSTPHEVFDSLAANRATRLQQLDELDRDLENIHAQRMAHFDQIYAQREALFEDEKAFLGLQFKSFGFDDCTVASQRLYSPTEAMFHAIRRTRTMRRQEIDNLDSARA